MLCFPDVNAPTTWMDKLDATVVGRGLLTGL